MAREFGEYTRSREVRNAIDEGSKIFLDKNETPYVIIPMIDEKECNQIEDELAQRIHRDYQNEKILGVIIAKGAMIFGVNMLERLGKDGANIQLEYLDASSYGSGMVSNGIVRMDERIDKIQWGGTNVVIFEDIVDTGVTIKTIIDKLDDLPDRKRPNSLRICALLSKPSRRNPLADYEIDYVGKVIPDKFVVGKGLDYDQNHRTLPYIGEVKFIGPSLRGVQAYHQRQQENLNVSA